MAERPSSSSPIAGPPPGKPVSGRSGSEKPNYLRDIVNATPGRFSRHFSRDRLVEFFKTLLWVAPLTGLIWIYAEREQQWHETQTIPIDVRTAAPDRIVRLISPSDKNIIAELSGPRKQLLAAMETIRPNEADRVMITVDPNLTPGRAHEIPTSQIQNNAPFTTFGISVSNPRPAKLTVYVDEIIEGEMPLRLPESINNLESPPVFDPPVVHYRAPRSAVEAARRTASDRGEELSAEVDLSGRSSLREPGQHVEKTVPVRSPFRKEENAVITPATVDVTLNLRPADIEWKFPAMPILVEALPGVTDRYKVELERPVLPNVTLIGPPRLINAMRDDEHFKPRPEARLKISGDDPTNSWIRRTLRYDNLPNGVRVGPEDEQRTIEFRLVERPRE